MSKASQIKREEGAVKTREVVGMRPEAMRANHEQVEHRAKPMGGPNTYMWQDIVMICG